MVTSELAKGHTKAQSSKSFFQSIFNFKLNALATTLALFLVGGEALAADPICVSSTGTNSIACGVDAIASGAKSVAAGVRASASGNESVAAGSNAAAVSRADVAMGSGAVADGTTTNTQPINNANVQREVASAAVALGAGANATGRNAVAIGAGAQADTTGLPNSLAAQKRADNVAIGAAAKAAYNAVASGFKSKATGISSVAIGPEATADADYMIAIGIKAGGGGNATNTHGIAIGNGAGARATSGTENVAIGRYAGVEVNGNTNYAFGVLAGNNVEGADNFSGVIKAGQYVKGSQNIALGYWSGQNVTGNSNVALGKNAGQYIGSKAQADRNIAAHRNIAIGENANKFTADTALATSDNIAVGSETIAKGGNSVAIGRLAQATLAGSVALGEGSNTAGDAVKTSSAKVNGITYSGFAGDKIGTSRVVSVGTTEEGKQRQIKNVAAGQVTATSTNAINGSQLYMVANTVGNVATTMKNILGGDAKLAPATGNITMSNIGGTGQNTINDAIKAANSKVQAGTNIANVATSTDTTDGRTVYTVNAKGTTVSVSDDLALTTDSETNKASNITDYKVALSDKTKEDIKKGVDAKEKVDSATFGLKGQNGKTVTNTLNNTVEVRGADKNISTKVEGGKLQIELAKTLDLGENGSVTMGDTNVNGNGLTITGGPSITKGGINAGGNRITNVAAGENPTDAVNKSQLDEVAGNAAKHNTVVGTASITVDGSNTNAGGGIEYQIGVTTSALAANANGSIETPANTDALITAANVANAINASGFTLTTSQSGGEVEGTTNELVNPGETVTIDAGKNIKVTQAAGKITVATADDLNVNSVKAGDTLLNKDGVKVGDNVALTKDGLKVGDVNISTNGINAGDKKVTGVADGDISATSKDAVNGSQLYTVQQAAKAAKTEVEAGDNIKVTSKTGGNGQTIYTVATKKDVSFDNVNVGGVSINKDTGINAGNKKVTGVAAGDVNANSTDAVNGSQLHETNQNVAKNAANIANNTAAINKGLNFTADDGKTLNRQLGDTVAVNGDENITTSVTSSGVKVALNKNLKVDSVTAGNTVVNNDGVTIGTGDKAVSLTQNGLNNGGNRITNVAPGKDPTDAVNVAQLSNVANHLDNKVNKVAGDMKRMDKKLRAGIAGAAALGMLPQPTRPGKSMVSVGGTTYRNESAVALGVSRVSDNEKWVIKVGASANTRNNYIVGGSVGYQW
ncbi:YadA-like family protein [Avibacterium volantium]|uniref:Haemagglutinin n=1 Tax=Avibacterium volantium TaxID=762 RepID=A0A447SPS2_AVIVO|nr:YadA-like family protein [Avibacterium volantium]VEB23125.1 Haemagglutinin [Avibacterium volantium]